SQGGTVVSNGNGTFTYTPALNFNGSDSFTYDVSDGNGGTDTATVTITVSPVNDAPVANNNNASTTENMLLTTGNVLLNDTDVDGDILFVSGFDSVSAQGGTVVSNGNGTFNFTPALNFIGTDSFTYDVSDGNGGTDTGTVTIVVNGSSSTLTVNAGTDVTTTLFAWQSLMLDGSVSGQVGSLATAWSVVSGPGTVYFEDIADATSNIVFGAEGQFVLRYTATDSLGTTFDDVVITVDQPTVQISPTGDSITQADIYHQSYRRPLWFKLQTGGYDVDFVGSQQLNHNGPNPYSDFDLDHEGWWGLRAPGVGNRLITGLQLYTPDVVLLHIGHNDLRIDDVLENTLNSTAKLIAQYRADNPNVVILLAQLIPSTKSPRDVRIPPYNALIPGFAASQTTLASPVIVVDHFTGYDGAADNYDGVHPNSTTGEYKMAQAWYDALVDLFDPSDIYSFSSSPPTAAKPVTKPSDVATFVDGAAPSTELAEPNDSTETATFATFALQKRAAWLGDPAVQPDRLAKRNERQASNHELDPELVDAFLELELDHTRPFIS
ncbi:MAG: tandem-95 repeat protein, partial [Planctomycetales bacterium]|nr:tandem-95 repeat protein [Planctomycetales bacterium]